MAVVTNIDGFRDRARARLPRLIFDYLDGGALSETTLRANRRDFSRWTFEARMLRDIGHRDLRTDFLGRTHAMPLMLGPVGFAGLFMPHAEVQVARAAAAAGVPYCLPTLSMCSLEEVRAASNGVLYLQLYITRNRSITEALLDRAEQAQVDTVFLTIDTPMGGIRESDTRNGFRLSARPRLRSLVDMALHPRWWLPFARHGRVQVRNVPLPPGERRASFAAQVARLVSEVDPCLTWQDVAWLRRRWKGRLILKGILCAEDARLAIEAGADGIVVSNHGGRQLDGAPSSIAVLPEIVDAVQQRIEVLFDSGIRRGTDVMKAVGLGASAGCLGRAYAYALAAAGEGGVAQALQILRNEIDNSLGLMGLTRVAELSRHNVVSRDRSSYMVLSDDAAPGRQPSDWTGAGATERV